MAEPSWIKFVGHSKGKCKFSLMCLDSVTKSELEEFVKRTIILLEVAMEFRGKEKDGKTEPLPEPGG